VKHQVCDGGGGYKAGFFKLGLCLELFLIKALSHQLEANDRVLTFQVFT